MDLWGKSDRLIGQRTVEVFAPSWSIHGNFSSLSVSLVRDFEAACTDP